MMPKPQPSLAKTSRQAFSQRDLLYGVLEYGSGGSQVKPIPRFKGSSTRPVGTRLAVTKARPPKAARNVVDFIVLPWGTVEGYEAVRKVVWMGYSGMKLENVGEPWLDVEDDTVGYRVEAEVEREKFPRGQR